MTRSPRTPAATQPRISAAPEAAIHQRALIFMGARSGASGVSGPRPIGAKMTPSTTISRALGSLPDRDLWPAWLDFRGPGVLHHIGITEKQVPAASLGQVRYPKASCEV